MDTGVQCNKEMVDLLMRIKKHLKSRHGISLNLSDPHLMTGLLELATVSDQVLQGMIRYLMALAGDNWNRRYLAAAKRVQPRSVEKSLAETLRDRVLEGTAADPAIAAPASPQGARVRYYRGQPVHG